MATGRKVSLTNTGDTVIYMSYQRLSDGLVFNEVELNPNQTKRLWYVENTFSTDIVNPPIVESGNSVWPPTTTTTTASPTSTPASPTPTPTGFTPTATATLTPTSTPVSPTSTPASPTSTPASPTPTPTRTPTPTPTTP